jgi:hypothetical protein
LLSFSKMSWQESKPTPMLSEAELRTTPRLPKEPKFRKALDKIRDSVRKSQDLTRKAKDPLQGQIAKVMLGLRFSAMR